MAFLYGDPFTIPFKLNIPSCLSGWAHPGTAAWYRSRSDQHGYIIVIKNQKLLSNIPKIYVGITEVWLASIFFHMDSTQLWSYKKNPNDKHWDFY